MKKVIFKNGLKAFLATFCFLVLGAVVASAQTSTLNGSANTAVVPGVQSPVVPNLPVYTVPQGNFYGNQQALSILEAELVDLKNVMMANQNEPTIFAAMQVKYRYFNRIHDYLQVGATTPNAIAAGLWFFLEWEDDTTVPSTSVQETLKQEAIDLLS